MKLANRIVMTAAGVILIVAAALKAHQLLTEPIVTKGFWESWGFFLIQIPLEMGLGIWLVSQLFRKAAWLIAVIAFGGFIAVTAQKWLAGDVSCGCFGRVTVRPELTLFTIDVPLFILLLIFRPRGEKLLPPPWPHPAHFIAVAIPTCLLLGVLVPTLAFNKPADVTNKHEVINPKKWFVEKPPPKPTPSEPHKPIPVIEPNAEPSLAPPPRVEPNTIVAVNEPNLAAAAQHAADENDLPQWRRMLQHVDIRDQLLSGISVVYFYHYDCPDCAESMPYFDQKLRELGDQETFFKFAFVKAPPYGPDQLDPLPEGTPALVGKLDESKDWIFETPLILLLKDGSLIRFWQVDYPEFDELLQLMATSD